MSNTTTVHAPVATVFDVITDPTAHPAIDGTGWVREPIDRDRLTHAGQIFRVPVGHANHPDGSYEMVNRVELFEARRAIAWKPGLAEADGTIGYGGWIWRYDLASVDPSETNVVLSYDWSAVSQQLRERIGFPPFGPDHLENSLHNLAGLAESRW